LNVQNIDDIRGFVKKIEPLKMDNIDFLFYEMLPLCGAGTAIAFSRFIALHNKICIGSYSLIGAYKKDHTGLWGEYIGNNLWQRSMHFENAILAYNSIVDYVYAILYFNFDLYVGIGNTSIKDKDDIIRISRSIKRNVISKIDEWLANQNTTKDFYTDFSNYQNVTKDLRELANDIKHRGHISFEGLSLPRTTKVTLAINGSEVNITELVSPTIVNMEIEINNLVDIHKLSFDIQKKLYRLCGFQDQLKTFLDSNLK